MSIDQTSGYTEYKYRQKFAVSFLSTLMAMTLSVLAVVGYLHEGGYGSLVLCLALSAIMLLLAMNALVRFADIIVSQDGLHRRLLGRMTRFVAWDEMQVVRVVPLPRKDSPKPVHAYTFRSRKSGVGRSNAKLITFNDYKADLTDIINATNGYIENFHIPVEHVESGVRTRSTSI